MNEVAAEAQPLKLFVGGISAQTTTEMLSRHFSRYGMLTDAVVMMRQGRARGFGFVSFASEAAAAARWLSRLWSSRRHVGAT